MRCEKFLLWKANSRAKAYSKPIVRRTTNCRMISSLMSRSVRGLIVQHTSVSAHRKASKTVSKMACKEVSSSSNG